VGWLATWSYAGLDYDALERAHHAHHAEPATDHDPDFHRGKPGFISWYMDFMQQYLSWRQFGWLCLLLGGMLFALELPVARVAAFWAAPLILSTFQLFTVGTWLPHRPGSYLGDGPLKARSVDIAPLWSFLACYHFGYHFEHHARPDLPWWRLWRVRGLRTSRV
jgi:beta-carotene ketolase (CrtW type)